MGTMSMSPYGQELILDLHNCDPATYDTREQLAQFMIELCERIDMQREDLHFWDYDGDPEGYAAAPEHLKGTSAVQFIKTSNITIHTLDGMKRVYLNIFSCKDFDSMEAVEFCAKFFEGNIAGCTNVERI